MPLKEGSSDKTISDNVRELYNANSKKPDTKKRKRKQIIAIALGYAKKYKKPRQTM